MMGDRWPSRNLWRSEYIWLELRFYKITKLFLQSFREIYFLLATPLICLSNQLSLHGEEEVVWFIFVTLDAGRCSHASYSHYKLGVYVYFSHPVCAQFYRVGPFKCTSKWSLS